MLPLIKLLFAFVLMLAGIRFRLGLGLSILLGSLGLALVFGMSPVEWGLVGIKALGDEKAIFLAVILGLILVFSDLMNRTGQNTRLMDAVADYIRGPKIRLVFFPVLIGLLPMPGGAVFSAPMVETVSEGMDIEPVDKVLINYWFRHVWELAWPLFPGVILASTLADVPLGEMALLMSPGPIAMIFLGWFFILRTVDPRQAPRPTDAPRRLGPLLRESCALLTAIIGAVTLEGLLPFVAPGVPFEAGVIIAMILAIVVCLVQTRTGPALMGAALRQKSTWSMVFVILMVFVFKDVLQASGAVEQLSRAVGGEAALMVSAVGLPILVGMVSGINSAFVGAAFPLMLGLLSEMGMTDKVPAYLALGMFCGTAGVMGSPMHICFLLTSEYFKVDMARAWRRAAAPCATLLVMGLAYFFILV